MTSSTPSGWPEKRNASVPERVAPHASIAEALDRASERLAAAGLPSARREATSLWAVVAGKKPGDVWLSREETPTPQLVERFGEAWGRGTRAGTYAALDPAVRDFEPREALVSGVEGLDATRALLAGAAACMVPQGLLAVEIDERRAEQVRGLALGYGWDRVAVHDDLFGRPRFLLAFAKEEA